MEWKDIRSNRTSEMVVLFFGTECSKLKFMFQLFKPIFDTSYRLGLSFGKWTDSMQTVIEISEWNLPVRYRILPIICLNRDLTGLSYEWKAPTVSFSCIYTHKFMTRQGNNPLRGLKNITWNTRSPSWANHECANMFISALKIRYTCHLNNRWK